ncbi:MAG: YjbQ family protein [Acidobacteria bacterium]|nr:YjbQ family protein [Acidobacteriota bacterium]MBI3655034.1 YjbQ family protein [Acidobacteriota bacterium]
METLSSIKLAVEKTNGSRAEKEEVRKSSEVKFLTKVFNFATEKHFELNNITAELLALVRRSGIQDGILNVSSLHTTMALFINEYQNALLDDIKSFLEKLVGQTDANHHQCNHTAVSEKGYKHNCAHCSDCDRQNTDAHLGATVLGHNLCLQIANGQLILGQWQSIILAELDGPRKRTLITQIIGS